MDCLRDGMESRFGILHYNDQYNGRHAGEYDFLSEMLADEVIEDEGSSFSAMDGTEQLQLNSAPVVIALGLWQASTGGGGASRPAGGSAHSPQLLTGGIPSTISPQSPSLPLEEVPEYSHGGFDGGIEIGFDGTWSPLKFSGLIETLEEAKNCAGEIQKGPEGFVIELGGEEVLVMPTGGKVGGLLYKYRFLCRGVEFLVHSNPPKNRQPVRVRYLAESLIGNNFFAVHEQFVMPFLKRLGLTVHADKPSRIDMQVMIDVPVSEIIRLFEEGHVVTKLRKGSVDFTLGKVLNKETLTLGSASKVQVCIYDKGKELRSQKSNVIKEAYFIERCIGDEWINSGRPITRVEVRLGREALKCLGVNTVADLKERERGIVDLLTHDWFRILEKPKVRGHENTAAMHPVWERVRTLFGSYFSGADVTDVKWERNQSVSCDAVALERQALGCLSKALACRFGEQSSRRGSVDLAAGWVDRVQNELHEKLNCFAEHVRVKTGIELGASSYEPAGYDVELDYVRDVGRRKSREFVESFGGS
jgi:hypothetical protein